MSEGGHRVFEPKKLKKLAKGKHADKDDSRSYRDLIGRARKRKMRPLTNVERNDCSVPDDTPTARILDKEWNAMMKAPKKAEKSLSKRKLWSVLKELEKVSGPIAPAGVMMIEYSDPEMDGMTNWKDGWDIEENPYRWAVIGGGAFKLHGAKYATKDIDIAATHRLPEGTFPHDPGPVINKNDNGHYQIKGVKVDWMYRLDDGSGPLFKQAVKEAVPIWSKTLGMYLPVATMEHAMAIKVNAGRVKDVAVFHDFVRKGLVDAKKVLELIDTYVKG
jgi:hypothetical protein